MTKENNEIILFGTSDLALATSLSLWCPMESINRQNCNKAEFLFLRSNKLDKLINDYWNDKLRVSPRQYFNQLRDVKARLYQKE